MRRISLISAAAGLLFRYASNMNVALFLEISLTVASSAAALYIVTRVVARFGTKTAGALAAFPAITAITLLLVAFRSGGQVAAEAAAAVPLAMAFEAVSFSILCRLLRFSFAHAMAGALGSWLVMASAALLLGPTPFALNCLLFLLLFISCYHFMEHVLKIRSHGGAARAHSNFQTLSRLALATTIIALSAHLGSTQHPFLAGLMSSFPALPLATLVANHRAEDPALTSALAKSLVLNGMVNMGGYGIAAYFLYSRLDPVSASIAAVLSATVLALSAFLLMRRFVS